MKFGLEDTLKITLKGIMSITFSPLSPQLCLIGAAEVHLKFLPKD